MHAMIWAKSGNSPFRSLLMPFLSVMLASAAATPAVAAIAYTVTPLAGVSGITGGITNTSLNKWGQLIGVGTVTHGPVLWTPKIANGLSGKLLDLTRQPGFPKNLYSGGGSPAALNDMGQVVGSVAVTSGGDANSNVSWMWRPTLLNTVKGALHGTKGAVTVFPLVNTGPMALSEYPSSINNPGQITGHGIDYNPELFTPSVANGTTGTWTYDNTVSVEEFFTNDAGMVGGGVYGGDLPNNGSAFVQPGFPPINHSDLLSFPQWSPTSGAYAVAINGDGHVLVNTVPAGGNEIHGYLVEDGTATDIGGGDGAFPYAINGSDMATGARLEGAVYAPFLYTGGTDIDLETVLPATVGGNAFSVSPEPGPLAINDLGQILTSGNDGINSLFLLTPADVIAGKQPGLTSTTAKAAGPGMFTRKVTVKNTTGVTLPGPILVMFGGLPAGVSVVSPAGTTSFTGPAGSPYVTVSVSDLTPLATASLTVTFAGPMASAITYTARALAGAAPP